MKLLIFFILIKTNLFACETDTLVNLVDDNVSSFIDNSFNGVNAQICQNFKEITTEDAFDKEIKNLVQNQTNEIWNINNRHDMGQALNQCNPKHNSKALVLSFAGTGAYNPRTYSLMAKIIQCEEFQSLPTWMKSNVYFKLKTTLKNKGSAYTKWSGIEKGPLSTFIESSSLNQKARFFDYAIFPSEESEIIADPVKTSNYNLSELTKELYKSSAGFPKGISNALECTINYFSKAKEMGITPKLIVLSHSSGGRSVVKYMEKLKQFLPSQSADLVVTLDPVKEAQHAIQEVASQYAGKIEDELLDYIPFVETNNDKPVNVWTRRQPNSLYKTSNSSRWINFYQNIDTHGLGMNTRFGIHGSPINNADSNYFIKGLGNKAHGEICYDEEVLKTFQQEVQNLFN